VSEAAVWRWTVQLLLALHYLHSKHVLHRDLKSQVNTLASPRPRLHLTRVLVSHTEVLITSRQNVLLTRGPRGDRVAMLGDFGLSKRLDDTLDMAKTCIGTPFYMVRAVPTIPCGVAALGTLAGRNSRLLTGLVTTPFPSSRP
jgi:serine/threonine protein kinase